MDPLLATWPAFLADLNWSDLLYGLIPILYVVAQFFGGNDEKGKKGDSPAERKRRAEDEAARAERRRRIQEEIRRRITGEAPPNESTAEPIRRPAQPQARPEPQLSRHAEPEPAAPRPQQPATTRADGGYGGDIEHQLANQRKLLEKARTARTAARQQAADITKNAVGPATNDIYGTDRSPASTGDLRNNVLQSLRSARDIRAAFVLGEVLAPPISERNASEGRLL